MLVAVALPWPVRRRDLPGGGGCRRSPLCALVRPAARAARGARARMDGRRASSVSVSGRRAPPGSRPRCPGRSGWACAAGYCGSRPPRASRRCSSIAAARNRRAFRRLCRRLDRASAAGFRALRRPQLLPSGPRFEVRHAPLKIIRLDPLRKGNFRRRSGSIQPVGAGVLR